jgi:hypothetical protein
MFIPFETILKRKLEIYTVEDSKHTFLLRSYLAEDMDQKYSTIDNTYM